MFSKKLFSLLSATALTLAGGLSGTPTSVAAPGNAESESAGKSRLSNSVYIVRMAEAPVVAYAGGIKGYQATKPRQSQKIDPDSPQVVNYKAYLESRHDAMLASVGGGKKLYSYGYVYNGFAAELNATQAAMLSTAKGVLSVEKDAFSQFDTSSTPDFLGLSGPAGFWNMKAKGENVIIGIVDGGIWPEHLSFSDRTGLNGNATKDGKLDYQQIPGWHGKCTPGEEFNASNCNQKLIGARYYNAGFGGNAEIDARFPFEFNSPRDWAGHGTHTSSTAGGNRSVPATGITAGLGSINGIAPRARIATYKVCWADQPTGGGCANSDSVAAIDQAVADGVDVINFSISGTSTNFLDSVEVAFLFAADAGVFVAASAGNAGPTTSTVAHPGPWLTTVAAGTHNRNGTGSTTLGNAATYIGASFAAALGSSPLVDSVNVGNAGADATQVELCYPGTLNPAAVIGKVVLCKRGVIALVDKSRAVFEAGGVGAIIYNDPAGATSTLALVHAVPAVHVVAANGAAIKTYIAGAGAAATASIAQSTIVLNAAAPFTASFSSRGPLRAGDGDLLKPDLIAPGQEILAGVAPPNNSGRLFDLYSGTSMSSPHVAGLAALFKELHPSWSPMMIKSALMTTGVDVLDGGTPPAAEANSVLIFRQGAGHVQPNQAVNPGLVFNSGFNDWLAFLCGTGQLVASYCPAIAIDPSNLNVPSIAIGALAGAQTVTRTVTNVGGAAETYTATVNMPGFTVTLPGPFTVNSGANHTFGVSFLRLTAALNAYGGGQLRLTGNLGHVVRVPIVVRPLALAAPTAVSGSGGPISYGVTFGYTGSFTAAARGLVPAEVTAGTVTQDPDQTFNPADPTGTVAIAVVIPAGTTHARFSLFDVDVAPGSDIDLYVYNSGGSFVGGSGSGTSAEEVNLLNPAAGTYTAYVHGWGLPSGSSPFKLHAWALGSTAAGNMTVTAPASATTGTSGSIGLSFSGLAAGTKYLGSVVYSGASGMPNPTIVRVDTP